MEHGQINGALDVELEAARRPCPLDDRPELQGFPQAAKDQIRPDALHLHRFGLSGGMRIDDGQFLAEAQTRTLSVSSCPVAWSTSRRPTVLNTR
jgi:hypothetical protein